MISAFSFNAASATSATLAPGAVNVDFDLSVVGQMVAFSLLVIILKPLLFDPLLKVFEERERRTDGAKLLARRMDEEAGRMLRQYEGELDKVRRAASEERERLRSEGARVEAEIMAEARKETAKVVEEGKSKIARDAEAVRARLREELPELSREIASRAIGREVA